MNIKSLLFIILTTFYINSALGKSTTDSLLLVLDRTIEHKAEFIQAKIKNIDTLTFLLQESLNYSYLDQDKIYNELYTEYRSFNYDSAFMYSQKMLKNAYASKKTILIENARINLCFSLLSAGFFKETIDTLTRISLNNLRDTFKLVYLNLLARTYFDLADYTADSFFAPKYNSLGMKTIDLALTYCKVNSLDYLALNGLKYLRCLEFKKSRFYFEKLLQFSFSDQHQFAIYASSLSYIYEHDHESDLAIQTLIKAVIADIKASTKETDAIRKLAEMVYERGDVNRAYTYVQIAIEDAHFYGARHRKIQISNILPSIEDRQLEIISHHQKQFLIYSISVTSLFLIAFIFGIIIFYQFKILGKSKRYIMQVNQQLSEINIKLVEANLIKETYIGNFFDRISEYINRFEKLKLTISRKITTFQTDDVLKIITAIDTRKEREECYLNFDATFLKIFPHFMDEFNSMLKEKIIFSESGQILTPEVRIYALIRLGFTDNEKIASFLGYSLNTIYTYKTKIKNKLNIPLEVFDKKLLTIGMLRY